MLQVDGGRFFRRLADAFRIFARHSVFLIILIFLYAFRKTNRRTGCYKEKQQKAAEIQFSHTPPLINVIIGNTFLAVVLTEVVLALICR
jgi:hypothetical protein